METITMLEFQKRYLMLLNKYKIYGVTELNNHSEAAYEEELHKLFKAVFYDEENNYLNKREKNILIKSIKNVVSYEKPVRLPKEVKFVRTIPWVLFRTEDRIASSILEPNRTHISVLDINTVLFMELYSADIHTIEDLESIIEKGELPDSIAKNKQYYTDLKNELNVYHRLCSTGKNSKTDLNKQEIDYFNNLIKELNGPKGKNLHL